MHETEPSVYCAFAVGRASARSPGVTGHVLPLRCGLVRTPGSLPGHGRHGENYVTGKHAHRQPRGLTSRRRWGVTAGCTALVLAIGTGSSPAGADERPQRALQAVAVQLGTDGSVTGLTSSLISRDDTGSATETQALNPAEHAGDLPVQITTSWRHDGQVGTDLAELQGVSGRVEVNVTVQNTTLHPERFQYDAGGVAREGYELVATPMTVVASATLPEGSGGTLVQPQPGATEPGTTNGVIDTDGDATTVQWASLLAPPRLSAGTTFTLVQDTEDFQLPAINVAVQPGLATDTSIARLVGSSFDGSAALVGSENNTIGLITSVNATLAEVAESLETVQRTLSVNAGEVGTAATAALASTAASVDAAAAAVLADLNALDGSIGSTVQSTNGRAVSALQVSIEGVRDYFGTPADLQTDPAAPVPATGCGTAAAEEEPATTLLGQLGTVSRQLKQLSSASGDCVGQLRGALQARIGTAETCATPPADPAALPLVCQLQGAGRSLGAVATELTEQATAVLNATGDAQVAELNTALAGLVQEVQALQADNIAKVTGLLTNGGLVDIRRVLTALGRGLDDVRDASSDVSTTEVAEALGEIQETAAARLTELNGTTGVLAQLTRLGESICAFPADDAAAIDERDELRRMIDGRGCVLPVEVGTGDPEFTEPLADRLQAEVEAWEDVAGFATAATAELAEVTARLDELDGDVVELSGLVDGSVAGDPLRPAVQDLLDDLTGLYQQSGAIPGGTDPCTVRPDPSVPPLNQLAQRFAAVQCNQQGLGTDLQSLLTAAADDVRAAGEEDVAGAAGAAQAAGATADGSLAGLSAQLLQQLGGAADRQVEQGRAVVEAQQARLAAVQAAAQQELDASAQEAVGRLADQVAAANQQQAAAAAALQAQLQKVLVDLGSAANGRGLLGVMQNSAGQTGVRTEQVQETSQSAASFRGVRVAELADAQLETQQLARSLQAAQGFGPFAVDLPRGSTSSTVFVFRLGAED